MKKVGILTWHYYPNFGSALQAFALQKVIADMGYDVRIVDYENPKYGIATLTVKVVRFLLRLKYRLLPGCGGPLAFRTKYMKETRHVQDGAGVSMICRVFDVIVFGSDQIWAPNVLNTIYMGAYTSEQQKKVSYAASIGLDHLPDSLVPQYRDYLGRFSALSVRENKGKELLQQFCNLSSEVVLDPTLLIDRVVYEGMAKPVKGLAPGGFTFCYFLKADHSYRNHVAPHAQRKDRKIVGISANSDDNEWMTLMEHLGADEFLWLVINAETVYTDSYHCTIFSLLFHKNFWLFTRFRQDDPICQNSRIEQLNCYFNIAGHIVKSGEEAISDTPFDYTGFENRLNELRPASLSFLKKSLEQSLC